jgi:hypothetical protein
MVDQPVLELSTSRRCQRVILNVNSGDTWHTWHFPAVPRILTSEVLRKIAVLQDDVDGDLTLQVKSCTNDVLQIFKIAASVPNCIFTLQRWSEAIGFLCSQPSNSEISEAVETAILEPLRNVIPPVMSHHLDLNSHVARSDNMFTRSILEDGAAQAGRTPEEIAQLAAVGYDIGPREVQRQQLEGSHLGRLTELQCQQLLVCLTSLPMTPATPLCQAAAMGLMARSPEGALRLILDLRVLTSGLPLVATRTVIQVALRTLYVLECNSAFCLLPLECITQLRRFCPHGLGDMDCILPLRMTGHQTCHCCSLTHNEVVTTWPDPVSTKAALRQELQRRIPWLEQLASSRQQLFVTGSVLTESVARPGLDLDDILGDVDIFCLNMNDLEEAAQYLREVMNPFCPKGVILTRKSESRFRLEGGALFWQKCDVYVNSVERVRCYHMPMVRAAFCLQTSAYYVYPSCCLALATGCNLDFTFFSGEKNAFAVLFKKLTAGYSQILTPKERHQLAIYIAQVSPTSQLNSWRMRMDASGAYPSHFSIPNQELPGKAVNWRDAVFHGIL